VPIGRKDLLDRSVGDDVPRCRPAVTRHDHTITMADRHDGGCVGDRNTTFERRSWQGRFKTEAPNQ
jgi:hypothetical protein